VYDVTQNPVASEWTVFIDNKTHNAKSAPGSTPDLRIGDVIFIFSPYPLSIAKELFKKKYGFNPASKNDCPDINCCGGVKKYSSSTYKTRRLSELLRMYAVSDFFLILEAAQEPLTL
jgi:hypothetical protein